MLAEMSSFEEYFAQNRNISEAVNMILKQYFPKEECQIHSLAIMLMGWSSQNPGNL